MATSVSWKLKRYGRFVPGKEKGKGWKIYEAKDNNPAIVLTIVDCGYFLVVQGEESLDTIFLLCGFDSLRVHQKSGNLFFRVIVKEESRMLRMQFDGRSHEDAINQCSDAVKKLKEYVHVTTEDDAPPHPNQPPVEAPAPARQTCQERGAGVELEVVGGSVSIKRLAQHYLGETALTLPKEYHQSSLPQDDLEPILHLCLLDPSFGAFVEKVEGELKKLLEE